MRLYSRERVRREADLDKHLVHASTRDEAAAYELRYLFEPDPERRRRTADLAHVRHDYEVQFARDVLLAAPSWQRAELLASAAQVVKSHQRSAEKAVQDAFTAHDIDWSFGATPDTVSVTVDLDLGDDDTLKAGTEETVSVHLTNNGDTPLYRVAAVASDNNVLDGREFFFGRLNPGETRTYTTRVNLAAGWPNESAPVTIQVRSDDAEIASVSKALPVVGNDLPILAYRWDIQEGDERPDGVISVGDVLNVRLYIENLGTGPTSEAFARIRNQSGKALDILHGTLEPGAMVNADGTPCTVLEPGIEDGNIVGDASHQRIKEGKRPVYEKECHRAIAPGAGWEGSFKVEVREQPDTDLAFELSLGEADAFDHGAIMRSGFYDYFTQQEDVAFMIGDALPSVELRKPPRIEITRAPPSALEDEHTTISGVASDDNGVAHVMIFAVNDKAFFQGRGRNSVEKQIPFTADLALEPGLNDIAILVTDVDGLKTARSVTTYVPEPLLQAKAKDEGDEKDL